MFQKSQKFVNKKSQAGFSLVELMIVVAIIGLLAAIGIPQYQKFQARARQTEAKAQLSALFTAEKAFQGEWGSFSNDLANIGFAVEGQQLRYVTGFATDTAPTGYPTNAPPHTTGRSRSNQVSAAPEATWHPDIVTNVATYNALTGSVAPTTNTFTAAANGDPKNTVGGTADRWTINENKNMQNVQVGL